MLPAPPTNTQAAQISTRSVSSPTQSSSWSPISTYQSSSRAFEHSDRCSTMNAFQDGVPVPVPTPTPGPIAEEEEYYSSWSLFLVCVLLIISLWTSYYLQIKRIRAVHETLISIMAGMFVGFVVRLAPGHLIREMLVSSNTFFAGRRNVVN